MRLAIVSSLIVCKLLSAAPPVVTKVDPPDWWAGHSINPVRLLVRGTDLQGARVRGDAPGFKTGNIRVNDRGTYLFVDLTIPKSAKPGPVRLTLSTGDGSTSIPFEIAPTLPRTGRFQGFSPDDLIYLIMPDRFADGDPSNNDPGISKGLYDRGKPRYYHGGDLQGIIGHLPYLKDLGVTALWVNPIYDNVNHLNTREKYDGQAIADYHGYGAVDFYGVEEHFGTLAKFRELVDKAHASGIKIIQDQVANHTGPFHPWATDSPTPTWFNGTVSSHLANTWQTWTLMDPHSPPAMRRATLEGWFIGILPDLNQNDPEVARYLIQNTLWWIGVSGMDGIRQDTWPYVPRTFWRDWMAAIKREYPDFRVVGEMFDGDPGLVSFFQGGAARFDGIDTGLDSLFDFPLYYTIRNAFANRKPVRDVAVMLGHDHLYANPDMLVTFLGLHDVQRFMQENGADAAGPKLAFTLLLTARGIPMIYYGDEIAMPGGNDPDNRRDFPGGFPGDPRNAFTRDGRTAAEQSVFEHVQKLARLRAANDCLRRGKLSDLLATEQSYAYARVGAGCSAVVAINNSAEPASVSLAVDGLRLPDGPLHDSLGIADARVEGGTLSVRLPARSAVVYVAGSR
jgi:glycosidase